MRPQVREHLRHSAPEELHQVAASRWPRGDARAPPRLGRMTPEQLRALLVQVAAQAVESGELSPEVLEGPPAGPLFRPTHARLAGVVADWGPPVARRWGPQVGLEPRELAGLLARGL